MYSFAVSFLFPVKYGVLVLWTHLFLPRHFLFPPYDRLHDEPLLGQGIVNGRDYVINHS